MILIAGAPAAVDIAGWSPLAREIYERKRRSPQVYNYASLHELRFEMTLRAAIVDAARALDASGVEFAPFEYAHCNEMYWILTANGGFQLRPGVSPAAAIRDIYRNGPLYAFECATAIPIVYYKAVLDVLGDRQFDRLFQDLLLYSWNYDSDLGLIQEFTDADRAIPGDVLYFANPDHHPRMPEWQGVNVVVIDDNLFYGHGVGVTTGQEILAGLNARRRFFAMRPAYLMDLIVYPDFRHLAKFAPGAPSGSSSSTSSAGAGSSGVGTGSSPSPYTGTGMGAGVGTGAGGTSQPWSSGGPYGSGLAQPWLAGGQPGGSATEGSGASLGSGGFLQPRPGPGQTPPNDQTPLNEYRPPSDHSILATQPWLELPYPVVEETRSYQRIRARVGRRRAIW